jgi:hypothetical protein
VIFTTDFYDRNNHPLFGVTTMVRMMVIDWFLFNYILTLLIESGRVYSLSLRFPDTPAGTEFREAFGRCAYETMHLSKFEKVAKADRDYLLDVYEEDVPMTNVESLSENEEGK